MEGVRKSIHQSWLAKGLGLGLLCWGFKGVQEEIPAEEVSTLQIGSVYNFILVTDYLTKMGIKTVQTFLPVTFGYSLSSEAVDMRQLRRWNRLWRKVIDTLTQQDFHGSFQKLLERYKKCIATGEDYSGTYLMILVYIYTNSWKYLTVCKQMAGFKMLPTNYSFTNPIYLIYV